MRVPGLPSGRGATEQPNAAGDGDAALSPVFWAMVVLTGVAAGLFGDLMMAILFSVQHLAFGYHAGSLIAAVSRSSDARRLVVLAAAGIFGGAAWYLLRRYTPGEWTEIDDVVWGEGERLSFRRSLGTSVISEIVIGAAMQAPLTALALMLELTSGGFGILIPIVAATVTATVVARQVDGYSIYTARLRAR